LAINLNFYIHCRVCGGTNNGDIFPKPKGVEHFADFAQKYLIGYGAERSRQTLYLQALIAMEG